MATSPRTWLITGVSSGLGLAIARAALAAGDSVAGTARREADRAAFEALAPGRAVGLIMDLRDAASIGAAVAEAETRMGRIDILVNNAGYGLVGAIEEASPAEIRDQFEVNVFGPLAMIAAVLPGMRARRAGRILTVTSVSGLAAWGRNGRLLRQQVRPGGRSHPGPGPGGGGTGDQGRQHLAPGGLRTDLRRAVAETDAAHPRRL